MPGSEKTDDSTARVRPARSAARLVLAGLAASGSVAVGFAAVAITPVFFAIWPANAVLVGALVLAPRRWLAWHAAVLVAVVAATRLAMAPFTVDRAVGFAGSLVAVAVAVAVIRRDPGWIDGTAERVASWARFVLAGVIAPFAGSAVAVAVATPLVADRPADWGALAFHGVVYLAANGVACVLIVPAMLRLRPSRVPAREVRGHAAELVATTGLVALVTTAAMLQPTPAVLFAIPVPLAVLALRHGSVGAVLGSLAVVPIVVVATGLGHGPFAATSGDLVVATLWAQVFLILLMAAVWTTLSTLQHQREYRHDGDPAVADGVELACTVDRLGTVREVWRTPPAGRGPDETVVGQRWDRAIHPDDLATAVATFRSAWAGTAGSCVLRLREPDGSWQWLEMAMDLAGSDDRVRLVARGVTDARRREQMLEHRNQELRIAARTDALTGLANRRQLADAHETAWDAAAAAGEPLSMLVVDVDHFKAYNDRYGHDRGDRALVALGAALRDAVRRPSDLVARFGGEEFVVLLPRTGTDGALLVANRVLGSVRDRAVPHGPGVMTVSIGSATVHPASGGAPTTLFAAADAALYRAKEAGRDRVETARSGCPGQPEQRPV